MNRYAELEDAAWLREQYVELGRSTFHIAEIVGCSQTAVHRALRRHGVPMRTRGQGRSMPAARRRYALARKATKAERNQ